MFFVLLVKWVGGEIGIHAAFKPQSIWLWVRVPPGLLFKDEKNDLKRIKKDFTKCLVDWKSLHIFVRQIGLEVSCLIIQ